MSLGGCIQFFFILSHSVIIEKNKRNEIHFFFIILVFFFLLDLKKKITKLNQKIKNNFQNLIRYTHIMKFD